MIKFITDKVHRYDFPDGEMLTFIPTTRAGDKHSYIVVLTHARGGVLKSKLARDWIDMQTMPVKLAACDGLSLSRKGYDVVNKWDGQAYTLISIHNSHAEVIISPTAVEEL